MNDNVKKFNDFAQKHGAKKEVWDENLQFRYQNKTMREYSASIFGLPYEDYPLAGFTSETVYLQWCARIAGVMPERRKNKFHEYMQERLSEAEEIEILPGLERGAIIKEEVSAYVQNLLLLIDDADTNKHGVKVKRGSHVADFDEPTQDKGSTKRYDLFLETRADTGFGERAVFIRIKPLMHWITERNRNGITEAKLERDAICKWLEMNGKHYPRNATVNRLQSAYALRLSFVLED